MKKIDCIEGGPHRRAHLHRGSREWRAVVVTAVACLLAACAEQRIHDDGVEMMRRGDYEGALTLLDPAVKEHPASPQLRADAIEARLEALTRLLMDAARARAERRFDDARAILVRARTFDPNGERVDPLLAELEVAQRQSEALAQAADLVRDQNYQAASRVVAESLKDDPRNTELLAMRRRIEMLSRQAHPRQTRLRESRPITLDFRDASLRTVLDAVTRNSGINFILDKDLHADSRITLFLHGARVEDAIDLITSSNQLGRKIVDDQTVLIYPNTPDKQRDYQEQIVRVFYLSSTEAKGAAAFLKSMVHLRDPFVDERANMLAMRDTPENIEIAERLLAMYDTADPEVLLDLEVLEITSSRLTELGLQFPNSITFTPLAPAGSSGLTLGNIGGLTRNDVGVSLGSLILNLRREVGDTKTLANPSIRVRSKEKAKVMVGDKLPVITTTTGQTGFVADSVSYLDVGLQLEVEPTVYADDEVAIKMGLEVSSVTGQVKSANGTLAYQIGTRNANTLLRLRDGETQLLAGLISQDDQSSATRVPGLGDLPVAGRLFSSQLDNGQHTELVLAVTPHIVRNVRHPDASESELWVGTEAAPRLHTITNTTNGASEPASAASAVTSSAPVSAGLAASAGVAPAAAGAKATLTLKGPPAAAVGDIVTVSVEMETNAGLRGMPIQVRYNNECLSLQSIQEADFFRRDGGKTSFSQVLQADGTARAGVLRTAATTATGKGAVYTLQFKALKPGRAALSIASANAVSLDTPVTVDLPAPMTIAVH